MQEPEYGLLDKVNWIRELVTVFSSGYPQLGRSLPPSRRAVWVTWDRGS
jgi:hypothetical protein